MIIQIKHLRLIAFLLSTVILFHILLESNKTYSTFIKSEDLSDDYIISQVNEEQYYSVLNSFGAIGKDTLLKNTKVFYFGKEIKGALNLVYFSYYIITLLLIYWGINNNKDGK